MKNRLPFWFRQEVPDKDTLELLRRLSGGKVNTVCQQAHCPNLSRCFANKELTFMLLGNTCTRHCRFCAINKTNGLNLGLDEKEPERISALANSLGLDYAVITSVARDDLPDGGAKQFARTIECLRRINPDIKIEILIPDFKADTPSLKTVIDASPAVIAHNLETVRRLYPALKPDSSYEISLEALRKIKKINPAMLTKSALLLGLGERKEEVISAMRDLKEASCDILTLGQYLAPSALHYPVSNFIRPQEFKEYQDAGRDLGFRAVLSGPLVRSSYRAEELYKDACYA